MKHIQIRSAKQSICVMIFTGIPGSVKPQGEWKMIEERLRLIEELLVEMSKTITALTEANKINHDMIVVTNKRIDLFYKAIGVKNDGLHSSNDD